MCWTWGGCMTTTWRYSPALSWSVWHSQYTSMPHPSNEAPFWLTVGPCKPFNRLDIFLFFNELQSWGVRLNFRWKHEETHSISILLNPSQRNWYFQAFIIMFAMHIQTGKLVSRIHPNLPARGNIGIHKSDRSGKPWPSCKLGPMTCWFRVWYYPAQLVMGGRCVI